MTNSTLTKEKVDFMLSMAEKAIKSARGIFPTGDLNSVCVLSHLAMVRCFNAVLVSSGQRVMITDDMTKLMGRDSKLSDDFRSLLRDRLPDFQSGALTKLYTEAKTGSSELSYSDTSVHFQTSEAVYTITRYYIGHKWGI